MEGLAIILVYTLIIGGMSFLKGKSNTTYQMLLTLALGFVVMMVVNKAVPNQIISGSIFIVIHQLVINAFQKVKTICL